MVGVSSDAASEDESSTVGVGSVVAVWVGLGSGAGASVPDGSGAGVSDVAASGEGDVVALVVVPAVVVANAYDEPIASDIATVNDSSSDATLNPRVTRCPTFMQFP